MKKITIIDNSIAVTGAFNCALQEAELLRNEFNFVFILSSKSRLTELVNEKGFSCYTLPFREINRSITNNLAYFFSLFKNAASVKRILKKEDSEILQVNDYYNLVGCVARMFGFKGKLITYVRFLPSARPSFLSSWWSRMAIRYADKVVCVSDAVLREMPVKHNVLRIYDPVTFVESPVSETSTSKEVILLYLANYITGKGQNYALEAFAAAAQTNSAIRLRFVGGDMGLEKNRQYRKGLEEHSSKLGLDQVVEFAGFTNNTNSVIQSADIVLNFSDAESFSMTCAEASFYGKPVIATKCGGPEEIIVDGQSGLLVDKKNIRQMTQAMLDLAGNAEKRQQFGQYGRNYVKKKFTPEVFIDSFREMV